MSVYFARVGRYVKVGYSANPERRVHNLFKSATRYGAPRDLSTKSPRHLIAAVPGDLDDEGKAHRLLAEFRVFEEWYIDEPQVRSFIAESIALEAVADYAPKRPAGRFDWLADPVLNSAEDIAWDARAAAVFDGAFSNTPA